jgi:hypothetical protein
VIVICARCEWHYDDATNWTLCPHAERPLVRLSLKGLEDYFTARGWIIDVPEEQA